MEINILKIDNISKNIKNKNIVTNISMKIKSKEVIGLFGPNGAGKTTIFYMIAGLNKVSNGEIYLNNEILTNLPLSRRAKLGLGYLPQESSIFKDLTVEENLWIATEGNKLDEYLNKKKIEELLYTFKIQDIRFNLGIHLSGGERRRVEIARALVSKPKFLLLDEPFAGIDPIAINDIKEVIKELSNLDIGILITDHNVKETLNICNKVYIIKDGEILISGTPDIIIKNKDVQKYYLGNSLSKND